MKTKIHVLAAAVCSCCFLPQLSLAGLWIEIAPPFVTGSGITGIAALKDSDVWAVGDQENGSFMTLTEHWDGSSWSVVSSPNEYSTLSILNGVTALARNDVWAVGYGARGDFKTIAMHWDGTAWTNVQTPDVPFRDDFLNSVSAIASGDVWSVGYSDTTSGPHHFLPLAIHWDGAAWTIVPTPMSSGSIVEAVAAISNNDVWAVGNDVSSQDFSNATTYIMHWDGSVWSTVPSPNGTLPFNRLSGVAGVSADDVWAVGSSSNSATGDSETLAMHWDGIAWSVMTTAPLTGPSAFTAAVAVSANNIWVVGSTNGQSLIERWNGRVWNAAPLPPLQDPSGLGTISAGKKSLWTAGAQATGQLFLKKVP